MRVDILTLFPEMFGGPFGASIIKRAQENGLVQLNIVNIRDFAPGKHRITDEYPYGGGAGMVMKVEPLAGAIEHCLEGAPPRTVPTILMSPQGEVFNQETAKELAKEKRLILVCGHYEGVDERVRELFITREISIGDYVLTGGELPAMVIVDAVVRLLPGALGDEQSAVDDSFYQGLLEYPQYTRPPEFRGLSVPEVLISGHHEKIRVWRRKEALRRTMERRPDLLASAPLTSEDLRLLEEIKAERETERETIKGTGEVTGKGV